MTDGVGTGLVILLVLAPVGMAAYVAMLWLPLKILGFGDLKERLRDISIPEAVIFGLYAVGAGLVVASLFSRFV